MKIAHINICRGLFKKIDIIEKIIHDESLSMLGLSEIDLEQGDPVPGIKGFQAILDEQREKVRVCLYVEEGIDYEKLDCPVNLPCIVIHTAQMSVGVFYSEFTNQGFILKESERRERLREFFQWFGTVAKKEAYVLGDGNYDFLKNSLGSKMLRTWASENDFQQVVKSPTREALTTKGISKTCLDVIFARGRENKVKVFEVPCSDHHGVWVQVSRGGAKRRVQTLTRWQVTPDLLAYARSSQPLIDVENNDIDTSVRILTEWLQDLNRRATLKKTVTINPRRKPWFTTELGQLKREFEGASPEAKKKARNKYVNAIKKAKRRYEREVIAKNATKGVWAIINKKQQAKGVPDIVVNGQKVQSSEKKCEEFRDYFRNKVDRLKSNPDIDPIVQLLRESYPNPKKWDISESSVENVAMFIDSMPPKKSFGPDGISNLLVKTFKWELITIMTKITNKCIREGIFPLTWREAKIVPVYKGKGKRTCLENYRPVALTSVLGKLVESVIRGQMRDWLDPLLPDTMYGFRPGRGTADAIIDITDEIKSERAKGKKVILLCCDASCAFELCSRTLVVESLKILGAGPHLVSWVREYLEKRTSYVQLEEARSDSWEVDCGVIQGGITSPDFYNVLTITQSLWLPTRKRLRSFADDSGCVVVGDTVEACQRRAEEVANKIAEWFQCVGLCLNSKKSEVMGFGFKPQPILVGDEWIKPKEELKFLGCWVSSSLKVDRQVNEVQVKVRQAAARIRMEGRNMSMSERKILYNSWINGQMCANGAAYLPLMNERQSQSLQSAVNCAVRAVVGLPRWGQAPVTEWRNRLGISSVKMISDQVLAIEAWKGNASRPRLLDGPRTRGRELGNFPHPDLRGPLSKCVGNLAKVMWNSLPLSIKKQPDRVKMRREVKRWIQGRN